MQESWLLLADELRHPPAILFVQVSLQTHWSTPGEFSLLADLSSDHPLPHPMDARLDWGHVSQNVRVDRAGRARFGSLPAALAQAPVAELSLTFLCLDA